MMKRDKEDLMSPKMHAKEWQFNASKKVEALILLDLIATLWVKSMNTRHVKVEVHVDDEDVWKRKKHSNNGCESF